MRYDVGVLTDHPVGYWRLADQEGYAQAVLSDVPVGYWRLGEPSGATAVDACSAPHNGTYAGSPALGQAGLIADGTTGVAFDGANDEMSVPSAAALNFDWNVDFTVEIFAVFPATQTNTASTTNVVIEKWDGAAGAYPYVLRINNQTHASPGKLLFARYDGTHVPSLTSTVAVNDSLPHHILCVRRAGTLEIWIDGVQRGTTPDTTTTTTTNAIALYLGRRGGATQNWLTATALDEAALYNYALSAQQIANHYTLRTSTIALTTATTIADASGNGHTGAKVKGVTLQQSGVSARNSVDKAALFDGVTGRMTAPITAPTTVWSIEAWLKHTNAASGERDITGITGGVIYLPNGGTTLRVYSTVDRITGVASVANGAWHHVVVTCDNTTTTLYVDGAVDGTPYVGTINLTGTTLSLGQSAAGANPFDGSFDEVAIYDYALTPLQVAGHYLLGLSTLFPYGAQPTGTIHRARRS